MKFKSLIGFVGHTLARLLPFTLKRTPPPPEQLDLGLDQITDTGLSLREAIPVRSAEYWLRLGDALAHDTCRGDD